MSSVFGHTRVLRGTRFVCLDCGLSMGDARVAANFKKLRKEPWAKNPENAAAIEMAERRYPHDKRITPWLLREFRKQRLMLTPDWIHTVRQMNEAQKNGDEERAKYFAQQLEGDRPDIVFFQPPEGQEDPDQPIYDEQGRPVQPEPLQPGMIQNLTKMLDHYDQRQQPIDLMGKTVRELEPEYEEWKANYKERDPQSGQVVHTYPNGWTMRRVEGQDEVFDEGEEMRNCVPKYVQQIGSGSHHLFSLRDKANQPKANVLIVPQQAGGHWDGGTVVDIREQANRQPRPSPNNPNPDVNYKHMIRDFFENFNTPPTAHFNPGPPGDEGPGHPEEYGIEEHRYGKKGRVEQPMWSDVEPERDPWIFTADRMDLLNSAEHRPDLQAPEAQSFLAHLRNSVHSPKSDVIMPFLVKEWKAGRAVPTYRGVNMIFPETMDQYTDKVKRLVEDYGYSEDNARKEAADDDNFATRWTRETAEDLGDWWKSNHPSKKGLDLNSRKLDFNELYSKYKEYEDWKREREDREDTVYEHHNDGKKTGDFIKRLRGRDCADEGTKMNNCISGSGYGSNVDSGHTLLYSVRDKNNEPHVTFEVRPEYYFNPKTKDRVTRDEWQNWQYGGKPEDYDDYEPDPRLGKVIQIQGKNNAPPDEKYVPLVKQWFQSKLFNPPHGEDWRPTWNLSQTHFNNMSQLYSPVRQHIVYYHPGDYGLEDPGVTSDYKGLVRTLPHELDSDPDHKRLPFLVDWAQRHGELDQLRDAIKDPETERSIKSDVYIPELRVNDDQAYADWQEQNPRPQYPNEPVGPSCPGCHETGWLAKRTDVESGEPFLSCNWCGNDHRDPELTNAYNAHSQQYREWEDGRLDWLNNVMRPWEAQQEEQLKQARERVQEPVWQESPQKAMLDRLDELHEQARGGTAVHARYACTCGVHDPISKWSFVVEANMYNRLRNQLKKDNIWDDDNELLWNVVSNAYPNHDKYGEWLHREGRKGRLHYSGEGEFGRLGELEALAKRYQGYVDNPDTDEYDRNYYAREADNYRQRATRLREDLKSADPSEWEKARLSYTDDKGKQTDITPDLLEEFKPILQSRKNKGEETNLMKIPTAEIIEQAQERAKRKRAKNYGTVIHPFKDGWSIRKVNNAEEAKFESDELGHCMGSYGEKIESGRSHNYSLRDPDGMPRLSLEIKHQREPRIDWDAVHSAVGGSLHECPSCKNPIGRDGYCHNCGFNYRDLERWVESPQHRSDIESAAQGRVDPGATNQALLSDTPYHGGDHEKDSDDRCPTCGSLAKEPRLGETQNWFCLGCQETYPRHTPRDLDADGEDYYAFWDNNGVYRGDKDDDRQTYNAARIEAEDHARANNLGAYSADRIRGQSPYQKSWEELEPELNKMGLVHHDFRDGTLYQIEGKSGKWPHPKYHRYIREWMGSIPHDERPTNLRGNVTYYAGGNVINVDDIDQAPGFHGYKRHVGTDDFGFKFPNRKVDYSQILHSLHPESEKEWGVQSFSQPQAPPDAKYDPRRGQRLFDYALENNQLDQLAGALNQWGQPKSTPYKNLGNAPCTHCGMRGFLHRSGPSSLVTCSYCGESSELSGYGVDDSQGTPDRPTYTPYQAAVVEHLGTQLADRPSVQQAFENSGGSIIPPCPNCGGNRMIDASYEGYYYCPDCGRETRKTAAKLANEVEPVEHIGWHGQPCRCLWHPATQTKKANVVKVADKFNDLLMNPQSRPDLQTPEAQAFLQTLQGRYLNEKTDALMPWLVREWKKGRINHVQGDQQNAPANPNGNFIQYTGPEDYEYEGPNGEPTRVHGLRPDDLNHWADWYDSNHHTRQGVDIMQLQSPDLVDRVRQWNNEMREQAGGAAEAKGKVVYDYPDGWTVQQLNKEKQLKDEGEKMGHCVGGYWPHVQRGRSLIYSLRDHHNEPHATWEITPQNHGCKDGCDALHPPGDRQCRYCEGELEPVPHGGTMVQIQGKGNEAPIPEYQERIKDYFQNSFKDEHLPEWDDQLYSDPYDLPGQGYTEYHEGDYGLNEPRREFDWYALVRNSDGYEANVYDAAEEAGQSRDLQAEVDDYASELIDEFNRRFERDWEVDPEGELSAYGYEYEEPEPREEDFLDEEGDIDYDAYNDAVEEYKDDKADWIDSHRDTVLDEAWEHSEEYDELQGWDNYFTLPDPRYAHTKPSHRVFTKKVKTHNNFATGKPCSCTFTRHLKDPIPVDGKSPKRFTKTLLCEVCGNELEGSHCPQCDWGGFSTAMDPHQNPIDPVKDLKSPVQASSKLWEMVIPADRWKF